MASNDLRNSILDHKDDDLQEVVVPEWNGTKVWLRPMTGAAMDSWLSARDKTPELATATLLSHVICDEGGKRVFLKSDIPALAQKSSAALKRLLEAVMLRENLTDADPVEDAKGN